MREITVINGALFNIGKDIPMADIRGLKYKTLEQCYNNPSSLKKDIYERWQDWEYEGYAHSVDFSYYIKGKDVWCICGHIVKFGIRSYNTNMFTLHGIIADEDGNTWYFYITKTKQVLHRVIEE